MKKFALLSCLVLSGMVLYAQKPTNAELARWNQHAKQTTIIRDEWDIPHIYGRQMPMRYLV